MEWNSEWRQRLALGSTELRDQNAALPPSGAGGNAAALRGAAQAAPARLWRGAKGQLTVPARVEVPQRGLDGNAVTTQSSGAEGSEAERQSPQQGVEPQLMN